MRPAAVLVMRVVSFQKVTFQRACKPVSIRQCFHLICSAWASLFSGQAGIIVLQVIPESQVVSKLSFIEIYNSFVKKR